MYRIFWEGLGGENTAQTPVKQEEKVGNFTLSMSSLLVSGKASFRQINQLFFGHVAKRNGSTIWFPFEFRLESPKMSKFKT